MTATASEFENLNASIMSALDVAAVTALVPTSSWILEDLEDVNTEALSEWIEPTVQIFGNASRGSREARVSLLVRVYVKPHRVTADAYRRRLIADTISRQVAGGRVVVGDYANDDGATQIGTVRMFDGRYINLGRDEDSGANVGVLEVDGFYAPQ